MRAYVDLASGLDPEAWRARHLRDEVPDASPYGLHRLEGYGVEVTFRRPVSGRVTRRIARSAYHRSGGYELVEAAADLRRLRAAHADAVLGYDERTSVPAALRHARRAGPPVLAGVGWLTTRTEAPPVHARLAAAALPRAGAVFTQCQPLLPLLTSEWGVPADRVSYVEFGIDTDFFAVQPAPDRPGVVASAGEDRFRDHQLLIDAVASLRARRPNVTLELATALPVDLPTAFGVRHTERLDGRMRAVYRRASVVAVALRPCLTGSGLSVMLEAMASGRPLVATDNPGIADYVRHGVTGLLVPPGDVDAMAAAIGDLLDDPAMASELAAAAAAEVRERFTSTVMAGQLAELLRRIA